VGGVGVLDAVDRGTELRGSLLLEVVGAPLFIYRQSRVAQSAVKTERGLCGHGADRRR
jgi:hypothetical protein